MLAADPDADADVAVVAAGADVQDGQGGAGTAAPVASEAPHVVRAPYDTGPGGDAMARARRPGIIQPHIFALSIPFPTPLEAEIALGSLAPDAEPHQRAVEKDLTVSGSILAVHWRAEDSRLLRISVMNFLDHLSLVVQTMQRFGPPVSR
ncbi:EKC/KEOPS complex subunit LAGE3 [Nycticebus coucang]|uniref:EKC/KEOPS complex subunit LAGE3 n=1 Tax=Nycticebus coucang TaxID=9470 RepID=UPI00234D970A|nr:EKC/KEOPS complex subunit LAGE3 [Nycticebus coucang]